MLDHQYAYIVLCIMYGIVWLSFWLLRKDIRKELVLITLCTAPLGLTEWFYYDYWRPEFLFPLMPRIGIEDFLWVGLVSGLGATCYEVFAKRRTYHARKLAPNWMTEVWLSVVIVGGVLTLAIGTQIFGFNSAYISIMGFIVLAANIVLWRHDLVQDALKSGALLAVITFCIYQIWLFIFPDIFKNFWQLHALSNVFIYSVPIEELLYLFAYGAVIGPLYELIAGLRLRRGFENKKSMR